MYGALYRVVLCRQRATLDPTGGTGGRETARMRDRVDFPKRKSIIPYTKVPKTRNSEIRAETRRRSMGRGARAQKTTPSIVLCICTGPTLSTENLSPCARESSSLPNPPTPSNSPDRTPFRLTPCGYRLSPPRFPPVALRPTAPAPAPRAAPRRAPCSKASRCASWTRAPSSVPACRGGSL